MVSIISKINTHVFNIYNDESVAALLRQKIRAMKRASYFPPNYYFVTHLTNPASAFWTKKFPKLEKSTELTRKLSLGKKLERFASIWFHAIEKFSVEEGKIDGVWNDLPGVRGSIDYRIGDSIVEFKTKETIPNSSDEIFEKYPQDVEQLAFYSVIHPDNPKVNYLVFMEDSGNHKIMAFRVTTNDFGRIKSLLKQRMQILTKAFEENDPSILGQCRYYEEGCQFGDAKKCICHQLQPLSISHLKQSLAVSYDAILTNSLTKAKENWEMPEFLYTTKDIITPRQQFMQSVLGVKKEWTPSRIAEEYKACIEYMVRQLPTYLSPIEKKNVTNSLRDPRLRIAFRWLKIKSSIKERGYEIMPYTTKASSSSDIKFTNSPHPYHLTELGIICSAYGKSQGMIFYIYPNLDNLVKVFQVSYKDTGQVLKYVREVIRSLESAKKPQDLMSLNPCPDWMNKNKSCPLTDKCNASGCIGCLS